MRYEGSIFYVFLTLTTMNAMIYSIFSNDN